MTGVGLAMPGGSGLQVRFDRQPWNLLLRRADFAPEHGFGALHGAPVRAHHIARYAPNWKGLLWLPVPDNALTHAESWAQDPPYQLNVRGDPGCNLTREAVIGEFLGFMARAIA